MNLYIEKAKDGEDKVNYRFKAHKVSLPIKDEYDNPIETLVMKFDKKLEGQSDGDKALSEHDNAYYDVLVNLTMQVAEAKKVDRNSIGMPLKTWNNAARSKGLFADKQDTNKLKVAMYNARKRLVKSGFIKLVESNVYLTGKK